MYTPPESPGWYNTPSDDEISISPSSPGTSLENASTTSSTSHHHNDWFEYLVHPKKLDQHVCTIITRFDSKHDQQLMNGWMWSDNYF